MKKITEEEYKNYIATTIGKKIFHLRKAKKWSREKLAEKSNLSTTYIFDIENGNSMPSCFSIINICNALNIHSSTIFDEFLSTSEKIEPLNKNFYNLSKKEKAAVTNLINFLSNEYL